MNQSKQIQQVKHKESRFEKGVRLAQEGHVRKIPKVLGSQLYKVRSETKKELVYDVVVFSDNNVFCSCPDNMFSGEICKHQWAAYAQRS